MFFFHLAAPIKKVTEIHIKVAHGNYYLKKQAA